MEDLHPEPATTGGERKELKAFLFLTVVMAPAIAGATIVIYGFAVWFYQLLFSGPPTG